MKMKNIIGAIAFLGAVLCMPSCGDGVVGNTDTPEMPGDSTCAVTITTAVAQFDWMEEAGSDTRAFNPLEPGVENCIRTLTVLQFDEEGNLRQVPSTGKYYRFSDDYAVPAYPDGVMSLNLDISDFYVGKSTVCLIANMKEDQIKEVLFKNGNESDPVNLSEFKEIKVQMDYELQIEGNPNAGLVKEIFMFGYYEGDVSQSNQQISIAMARLVSRVDVQILIKDGESLPVDKAIYIASSNLERYVYLWPNPTSPHIYWQETPAQEFESISGESPIIYFYVAPNAAENKDDATSLLMWCRDHNDPPAYDTDSFKNSPAADTVLPLCNGAPTDENRNYYLNRNSYYRFNFILTSGSRQ